MGETSRLDSAGATLDFIGGGRQCDTGTPVLDALRVGRGIETRFKRKYPLPSVGDRFGELTITGFERVTSGACPAVMARAQCSCGAPSHLVHLYNLRKGASTRCNVCAKKQSGRWTKKYWGYADICPDDSHRRRLLGRISACINRCHNVNDSGFRHYGGRGIRVFEPWKTDRRAFLAYVITLDGWDTPRLELDRIDVDGGYAPGNLRFITRAENMLNKRQVGAMQSRIFELEARVRYLEQRAEGAVHDSVG